MNRLLFIMMLLPAGGAIAQSMRTPVVLKADTAKPDLKALLDHKTAGRSFLLQGQPSHTTSQGMIYVMPPDNMPCLAPDLRKTVPIPTQRMQLNKRMPNGITPPRIKPNKE